jgi:opacity protein-like surface antigen
MNSKLPTRLVTAVTLIAAGASAHGADLNDLRMLLLPQWTGVYLGGNLGGAFSEEKAVTPLGLWSPNSSGVFGGGQLGYNFMVAPNWLIGIEGELDSSAAQGTVVIPNMRDGLVSPRVLGSFMLRVVRPGSMSITG